MSAAQFREYAAEHLGWAKTARTERERQIFQQMAQAWLDVATAWESRVAAAEGERLGRSPPDVRGRRQMKMSLCRATIPGGASSRNDFQKTA